MSPTTCRGRRKRRAATLVPSALLSVAVGFPVATSIATESFRLIDDPRMQNDDSGTNGMRGYVNGFPYEVIQGHAIAEGDMVMGRVDYTGKVLPRLRQRGLGLARAFDRWPNGIVPYELSDDLSFRQMTRIDEAVEHWNSNSRMTLIERTADNADQYPDYVGFDDSGGCASWVGRIGGRQSVWVAELCPVGSIVHELGHAMGLFHEHTRPDRDNHVTVNWNNIQSGKEINFEIMSSGTKSYGPYDYGSIMHYGEYFFTNNGDRTIVAPANQTIGQRNALSDGDIDAINTMYATDLSLSVSSNVDGDKAELDVTVTNQGELGAHAVVLDLTFDNDTAWQESVSADPDWDCEADERLMRCELPLLSGGQVSRVNVSSAALAANSQTATVTLTPRTLDTNEANNRQTATLERPAGSPPPTASGPATGSGTDQDGGQSAGSPDTPDDNAPDSSTDEPETGAANPGPAPSPFAPLPAVGSGTDGGNTDNDNENSGAPPSLAGAENTDPDAEALQGERTAETDGGQGGDSTEVASAGGDSGGGSGHPALLLALLAMLGVRRGRAAG